MLVLRLYVVHVQLCNDISAALVAAFVATVIAMVYSESRIIRSIQWRTHDHRRDRRSDNDSRYVQGVVVHLGDQ